MENQNIGRNDSCPCGSGKKYKKCCLGQQKSETPSSGPKKVFTDLRQAIHGREFTSLEEVQAFAGNFMQQKNQTALDDFQGLSPVRMHQMVDFPFSSPQLVSFSDSLNVKPSVPVLTLFDLMVKAIGKDGLKATAKGNLPRNFCQETAQAFWGDEVYQERTQFGGFNKEEDFTELHTTRVVAEMAGMVRKFRGKFILSKTCRSLLDTHGMAGIYLRLFKTYAREFNWGYMDRFPEITFIQHAFLFTLYLLTKFGDDQRPNAFYEDRFLQAFPSVLNVLKPDPFYTPEKTIRSCYTWRTLVHFVGFFGLATVEPESKSPFEHKFQIKKLSLLQEVVHFQL
jgi:hypothetical protein